MCDISMLRDLISLYVYEVMHTFLRLLSRMVSARKEFEEERSGSNIQPYCNVLRDLMRLYVSVFTTMQLRVIINLIRQYNINLTCIEFTG